MSKISRAEYQKGISEEKARCLKDELKFLKKFKKDELPSTYAQDVGDGYQEDFNYDYPMLEKRIKELKKELLGDAE